MLARWYQEHLRRNLRTAARSQIGWGLTASLEGD